MGYWEEKQKYEKENTFCGVCNTFLTQKNTLGRCKSCSDIMCKACGKRYKNAIHCNECIRDLTDTSKKSFFGSLLTKKSRKSFSSNDQVDGPNKGVALIIIGALLTLTILGAVVGIPLIIIGISIINKQRT